MSRVEVLRPEFVDFIPQSVESGVLYVSQKYKTATHLCCCGCGNKVVTPLKPGGWKLTNTRGAVTIRPSIGSWSLPCQSHYFITKNKIDWAPQWSKRQIEDGRISDQRAREQHFDTAPKAESLKKRILRWLSRDADGT